MMHMVIDSEKTLVPFGSGGDRRRVRMFIGKLCKISWLDPTIKLAYN